MPITAPASRLHSPRAKPTFFGGVFERLQRGAHPVIAAGERGRLQALALRVREMRAGDVRAPVTKGPTPSKKRKPIVRPEPPQRERVPSVVPPRVMPSVFDSLRPLTDDRAVRSLVHTQADAPAAEDVKLPATLDDAIAAFSARHGLRPSMQQCLGFLLAVVLLVAVVVALWPHVEACEAMRGDR